MGSRLPPPPRAGFARTASVDARVRALVAECRGLPPGEATRMIARALETALADRRWDEAILWQRVRLRIQRGDDAAGKGMP